MNADLKIQFRGVVERLFSNWTGLHMAVEESMGGPHGREIVLQTIDHLCTYCFSVENLRVEEICEELEDILDDEFNTICEDNSPMEVSQAMWHFLQILKSGNMTQFHSELNNLPPLKNWLSQPQPTRSIRTEESSESDSDEQEDTMKVDPEWTVVKSNRRKK